MTVLSSPGAAAAWAVIAALAVLTYHNTFGNSFHFDDTHSIVDNPHIRSLGNIPRFFVDPSTFSVMPDAAMYRPLLLVTYALNYAIGDYDTASFHLVSLLLHIANAGLVYLLALRLLGCQRTALLCGALFAVHPVLSEPVNYISSRSSLLCTFFYLLAFAQFQASMTRRSGRWQQGLTLVLFAAALCSKSIAATLPAVAAMYLAIGRPHLARWRTVAAMAVIDVVYLSWSRGIIGRAVLEPVRDLAVHWATQLKAGPFYALTAVVPARLSVEPQFCVVDRVWDAEVALAVLVLASVVVTVWRAAPRLALGVFGVTWAAVTLLPSTVVPLNVLVNEHRLYLPMVGGVLAVGALVRHLRWAQYTFVAVVVALGLLTVARNRVWQDEQSLWADAVRKGPQMARPHVNLGKAYLEDPQGARLQECIDVSRHALLINPELPRAHYNIGTAYLRRGERELAIASFRRSLEIDPGLMEARVNLGVTLKELGRYGEAQDSFRRALQLADFAEVHHNLGSAFLAALQADSAAVHFRAAVARDPGKKIAYEGLAKSLRLGGLHRPEALDVLTTALARWPRDTGLLLFKGDMHAEMGNEDHAAQAYRTAGLDEVRLRLRLGAAARKRGDWDSARRHYETAEIHSGSDARIANALGEVELFEGRIPEALAAFRRAARLDIGLVAAYVNIGLAHLKHGDHTLEAAAALERAVSLAPESAKAWGLLGWAYDRQGDAEAAIRAYSRAIEQAPENAEQYHRLGMIYQSMGSWSEAERLYRAALARQEDLVQTHFNLGFVYLEQGRYERAVEQNQRVLELDPESSDAYVNLASAWLGLAAPGRAATAYERALEVMAAAADNPRRAQIIAQLELLKQGVSSDAPVEDDPSGGRSR